VVAATLLGPLASPSSATTYWAGNHYTCWGIKADISTPASPFDVEGSDYVPSWVSTNSFEKEPGFLWYWTQTGYTYQPSVYAYCRSYYEKHDEDGDYHLVFMSDHAWNFTRNYEVRYITSIDGMGEWGIFVNGVNKQYSFCIQDGALDMQAYTESYNHLSNMNGIFRNVKKRSQAGYWYNFDHGYWRQDAPYYVNYSTYYNYDTAGGY
jgi:hypothetical protein